MSTRFRTTFRNSIVGWLIEGDGERLWFAISYVLDAFAERVRQTTLTRYPQHVVDPKALTYIGADRALPRGLRESDTSYARRLVNWRGIRAHKTRGNGATMAYQIADFLPLQQGQEATLEIHSTHAKTISLTWGFLGTDGLTPTYSAPSAYPDSLTGKARFYIDLTGYPGWTYNTAKIGDPDLWDGGKVGGESLVGFEGLRASEADALRATIRHWKPAATYCDFVLIDGGRLGVS